jgi:hypothetical protein
MAKVFLDCQSGGCDFDYFRAAIAFVDWVRERADSDVHVLVTAQVTGSGGSAWTLAFLGQGRYAGRTQTLTIATGQSDSDDERRRALARTLRHGLLPYAAESPLAGRIDVVYEAPATAAPARRDRWNYWVFEVSSSANLSGEARSTHRSFAGEIQIRRITEEWKLEFEFDGSENRNRFQLDDSTHFTSRRSRWGFDGLVVKSLGEHWSAGALLEIERNSFRNYDLLLRTAPAVEFNFFPYRDYTRRSLTIEYAAGLEVANYTDTTIFGLTRERRPLHYLEISLKTRQPWGNTSVSSALLQYLHDTGRFNLSLNASASIRLVRGLSLNFQAGYDVIRDQLYLPSTGASPEEVIAQQRALATNYSYSSGFGLAYTFGSIYNNIVNPRL